MRRRCGLRRGTAVFLMAAMLSGLAAVGIALFSGAVWPEATGSRQLSDGDLTVDASNQADGYIMARAAKTQRRQKLRISRGDVTLTYDMNGEGEYEVIPLQLGGGEYRVTLYRCVEGNRYSQEGAVKLTAQLADEDAAYLCPNQYVFYTADSPAVRKSDELCADLETEAERYRTICDYVLDNFAYDYVRAVAAKQSAYLPDIDGCYESRRGICQDLAAMTACMLRVQGIPARLVIGYAGDNYHAWITAKVDGKEVLFDPTAELARMGDGLIYTAERYY